MTHSGSAEIEEIRAILAELQEEIRRNRPVQGEAERASGLLAMVQERQWVNSHLPIGWPAMPKGLINKLIAYLQKVTRRLLRWYITPLVEQQNAYNKAVTAALYAQDEASRRCLAEIEQLRGRIAALGAEHQTLHQELRQELRGELEAQAAQIGAAREEQSAFQQGQATVQLRLQRLENWYRGSVAEKASAPPGASRMLALHFQSSPGADEFLLGALYRNEEQMQLRLADYDDLLTSLAQEQKQGRGPQGPVLDIGCGRGEMVVHLQGLGLKAYGIDIDADAIQMGQEAQRDVRLADAFEHLASLADASLAGIVLIQVAEHLAIDDSLRLLRLGECKLAPGGFVILETINPTCLLALSNWFLLDPSHRTPLHPQMSEFLLKQAGFWRVQTRYLHPVPAGPATGRRRGGRAAGSDVGPGRALQP